MPEEEKKRTTVYLSKSLLSLLRARDINLSKLLNEVIYKALIQEEDENGLLLKIQEIEKTIEDNKIILAVLKDKLRKIEEEKQREKEKQEKTEERIKKLITEGRNYIKAIEEHTISERGWENLTNFLEFKTVREAKAFI